MQAFMFVCPACQQELEAEDSLRRQIVECPTCGADIKVPPRKKNILVKKPITRDSPTGSSARSPQPQSSKHKRRTVPAILAGILTLSLLAYIAGAPHVAEVTGRTGRILRPAGRMTKEQWFEKLTETGLSFEIGYRSQGTGSPRDEFIKIMGGPDRTQSVGDHVYWYYKCSDGQVQLVLYKGNLEIYGRVLVDTINHF